MTAEQVKPGVAFQMPDGRIWYPGKKGWRKVYDPLENKTQVRGQRTRVVQPGSSGGVGGQSITLGKVEKPSPTLSTSPDNERGTPSLESSSQVTPPHSNATPSIDNARVGYDIPEDSSTVGNIVSERAQTVPESKENN